MEDNACSFNWSWHGKQVFLAQSQWTMSFIIPREGMAHDQLASQVGFDNAGSGCMELDI